MNAEDRIKQYDQQYKNLKNKLDLELKPTSFAIRYGNIQQETISGFIDLHQQLKKALVNNKSDNIINDKLIETDKLLIYAIQKKLAEFQTRINEIFTSEDYPEIEKINGFHDDIVPFHDFLLSKLETVPELKTWIIKTSELIKSAHQTSDDKAYNKSDEIIDQKTKNNSGFFHSILNWLSQLFGKSKHKK